MVDLVVQLEASIGHVCQKQLRWNYCLVEDGDIISIDIPNYKLELLVDDETLARRKLGIKEPTITTGYLGRYTKLVSDASKGAVYKD